MTVGVKVGLSKEQRWDLAVSIQTSRAMTVDMKVGVRNKGRSLRCQRALISEATGRCINTSDPALGDDGGHIQVEVKINCQSRDLWLNYCTIILNYLFLTFCKLYAHRHRPCSLVLIQQAFTLTFTPTVIVHYSLVLIRREPHPCSLTPLRALVRIDTP